MACERGERHFNEGVAQGYLAQRLQASEPPSTRSAAAAGCPSISSGVMLAFPTHLAEKCYPVSRPTRGWNKIDAVTKFNARR